VAIDRKQLARRWVHAHEEDTDQEMVFRPAERELPPSRGRMALELREGGELVETTPGPVDRPEEATGSWELADEDTLVLRDSAGSHARRVLAAEPERLVLSKEGRASG
jgi:hypothetical protein